MHFPYYHPSDRIRKKNKIIQSEQILIKMNVKIKYQSKESEEYQMQEPKRKKNVTEKKTNEILSKI